MSALTRYEGSAVRFAPARCIVHGQGAAVLALIVGVVSSGCAVDDRTLVESQGGGGGQAASGRGGTASPRSGAGAGGVAGAPTAGSLAEAGQGGDGGGGAIEPPGCPDLDGSGVGDCDETLATNASFDHGYGSWVPEPDILLSWRPEDASAAPQPGLVSLTSARVLQSDSFATAGASQCIPVTEIGAYTISVHLFIPRGQGGGSGGIGALYFATENCRDAALNAYMSPTLPTVGEWVVAGGEAQVPLGTRSILVRLLTVKPFRQQSLEVLFDDVLVRKR